MKKSIQTIIGAVLISMCLAVVGCDDSVGGDMPTGTPPPTAEADAAANTLLDQFAQQVLEKKFSDAEATLKQLDAMKATVGADIAANIDGAKQTLSAAKSAG